MSAPELEVVGDSDTVAGWRYLWLKYVSGFDAGQHCARCLVGPYSRRVTKDMILNKRVVLDEGLPCDYLYLCGVASRGGWAANLHLAFVPAPDSEAEVTASTGEVFRVFGAKALEIPDLPRGFGGKTSAFTTCRNWRFGVARYGLPSTLQASAVSGPPIDH